MKQFWQEFCQSHNLECDTSVEAWAFGATAEDADKLADLVNRGIKTATTRSEERRVGKECRSRWSPYH